jgi:tRNA(Arg) A34 adenosine deaminase TadA
MKLPPPLSAAIVEASKSEHKHRVGAVVTDRGGRILGRGFNQIRGHRWSDLYEYPEQYHAETAALLNIRSSRRKPHTIYIARINRGGLLRLAKPCPHCFQIINTQNIKKIVYTTEDGVDEVCPV